MTQTPAPSSSGERAGFVSITGHKISPVCETGESDYTISRPSPDPYYNLSTLFNRLVEPGSCSSVCPGVFFAIRIRLDVEFL